MKTKTKTKTKDKPKIKKWAAPDIDISYIETPEFQQKLKESAKEIELRQQLGSKAIIMRVIMKPMVITDTSTANTMRVSKIIHEHVFRTRESAIQFYKENYPGPYTIYELREEEINI